MCRSNSEHLVTNPVQSVLPSSKRQRAKIFINILGSAWPWDPRGPGPYSNFLQCPLMIDLWMEEGQILMIFPYFSWKCRRSSTQEYALNTHTSCFVGCSPHVCLKKYMDSWDVIFFMTKNCVVLAIMDMVSSKSDVNGARKIVCFWRLWIKKWQKPKNYVSKTYRPNLYCIRLEVLYF